jgi:hypothetical protein
MSNNFYQDESALVEEVRSVIIEAAQECVPLWYRVWMESEFIVDEAEIIKVSTFYYLNIDLSFSEVLNLIQMQKQTIYFS